jgi:hypothetical protein
MPQFMIQLMRSGAMWSCRRTAGFKPRLGLWSTVRRWFGAARQVSPAALVFRSSVLRPGKPRY